MSAPAVQTHPAARAVQLLKDAVTAIGFNDTRAIDLVERAAEDVAATYEAYDEVLASNARLLAENIQLTTHVRGMRDQSIADAREITRLRNALHHGSAEVHHS